MMDNIVALRPRNSARQIHEWEWPVPWFPLAVAFVVLSVPWFIGMWRIALWIF